MMKFKRESVADEVTGSGNRFCASSTFSQENTTVSGTKTIGYTVAKIGFFHDNPGKVLAQVSALIKTTGTHKLRLMWLNETSNSWVQVGPDQTVSDTGGLQKTQAFVFMDPSLPPERVAWKIEGTKEGAQFEIYCATCSLLAVP